MLLKKLDRFPGGRLLIFLPVVALGCIGSLLLSANELTQVDNAVLLALTIALAYLYRNTIRIFLTDKGDAGNIWMSIGILTLVLATVVLTFYSLLLRSQGISLDSTNSRFVSIVRFAYAFSFGALYIAKLADAAVIPPRGWISLMLFVMGSTSAALFCMWLF